MYSIIGLINRSDYVNRKHKSQLDENRLLCFMTIFCKNLNLNECNFKM